MRLERPHPYVGVSGITTPEQARALLDMWPATAPPQSLMLGVLTSQKVMGGGERNARSPAPKNFARIFQEDPRVLGLVHYFTKDPLTLGNQLLNATALAGMMCHGAQINVPWPPPEQIKVFRDFGDYERVVLQVGPKMLSYYHHTLVAEVIDREYHGLITDVLIDVSAGERVPIDPTRAREMVESMRARNPNIGIGFAGGLCAETLPAFSELLAWHEVEYGMCDRCRNEPDVGGQIEEEIPVAKLENGWICKRCHARDIGPLSIDAEGRLRNDRDELDLEKVRAYLCAAANLWSWA